MYITSKSISYINTNSDAEKLMIQSWETVLF